MQGQGCRELQGRSTDGRLARPVALQHMHSSSRQTLLLPPQDATVLHWHPLDPFAKVMWPSGLWLQHSPVQPVSHSVEVLGARRQSSEQHVVDAA